MISSTRLRELRAERVVTLQPPDEAPARPPSPPPVLTRPGRLSRRWVALLVAAWVVVMVSGIAVEPAPADPDAAPGLVPSLIGTTLLATWAVMGAGLLRRHTQGASASLVGAVVLLGGAVACPLAGHHGSIGGWWVYQMAAAGALVALSIAALASAKGRSATA